MLVLVDFARSFGFWVVLHCWFGSLMAGGDLGVGFVCYVGGCAGFWIGCTAVVWFSGFLDFGWFTVILSC